MHRKMIRGEVTPKLREVADAMNADRPLTLGPSGPQKKQPIVHFQGGVQMGFRIGDLSRGGAEGAKSGTIRTKNRRHRQGSENGPWGHGAFLDSQHLSAPAPRSGRLGVGKSATRGLATPG